MIQTDYAVLVTMFHQVIELYNEGKYDVLRSWGLAPQDIKWIASLSANELLRFCKEQDSAETIYKPWFFEAALGTARKRFESRTCETHIQNELLKSAACIEMMNYIYGLTGHDVTARRAQLGLPQSSGRPPALTEYQVEMARARWDKSHGKPLAQRFLEIGQCGIPLNSAWAMLKIWHEEEDHAVHENASSLSTQTPREA